MLVVYYSWSNGNTKRIAEQLTNGTGADIARIETTEPYSGSHEDVVEQGKREVEAGFMPQINPISPGNHAGDQRHGPGVPPASQRISYRIGGRPKGGERP